jgi:glycosyltransferase involved in cell wall biosynthesis
MTATVIIPTTGTPELADAIDSVINQTYPTDCYVVVDGIHHYQQVAEVIGERVQNIGVNIAYLPINVGAGGFYGHRVYAAFSHLVNSKYILYLDQDNWLDDNHVQSCVNKIEKNNLDWTYSLRKIYNNKEFVCHDDCESLGKWPVFSNDYNHIDTNCYCIKTDVALRVASAWHGGWGQDRVWFQVLAQHFNKFDTTGEYSVNYRLGGNEGSVKSEFFKHGNEIMRQRYNGEYPWQAQKI